jgi:hypothetical protein
VKPPTSSRVLNVTNMPDGRRVSIVEASNGDGWMRITVWPELFEDDWPADVRVRPAEAMHIERGIWDDQTGTFIEWTDVRSAP